MSKRTQRPHQNRLAFDTRGPRRPDYLIRQPPHNRSATSRVAAGLARQASVPKRVAVYHYIARCGKRGATIEEISQALDLRQSTVCGRIGELNRPKRYIEKSGLVRPTTAGCPAAVWVATDLVPDFME